MKRLFTAGLIWLGALGYANSQNWKQAQTGVLGTGASHQFGINIGVAWIGAMQEACRALIGLQDATFADDGHWPAVPAGVAALASRF